MSIRLVQITHDEHMIDYYGFEAGDGHDERFLLLLVVVSLSEREMCQKLSQRDKRSRKTAIGKVDLEETPEATVTERRGSGQSH